ncbi:hypothetical protein MMC11_007496 [Xylographa trunciseda]|nr:hypothetical protein [Xylographa trunciseda]
MSPAASSLAKTMSSTAAPAHDEGVEALCQLTTVDSFPANSFVENIARAHRYLSSAPYPAKVVYHFPAKIFGIVEVGDDVFYISTGTIGASGSFAIYKAVFLNGSAVLDPSRGLFLVADSLLGAFFAIDTKAATASKWLQHGALTKVTDDPYTPGVNGMKLHSGHLYLSNTDAKTFLRVGVSSEGTPAGEIETVFERCNIDDFAIDAKGDVYDTSHVFNSVVKITSDGTRSRIAGGPQDAIVAGTTAAAFGRTERDATTLYVTTNGGTSNPVGGDVRQARLLALQVAVKGAGLIGGGKTLSLLASLVILSLTRLSAAQFNVYPSCVRPLLDGIFPANCLSLSLAIQNTCLCTDASTYANALVKGLYQACGCADLQTTLQLSTAYCAQVGIDVGPAFSVFVQDDTPCSSGTGTGTSAGSGGSTSLAGGSTGTATAVVASTPTGSSPTPVTVFVTSSPAGSSTNTAVGGGTTTVVVGPKNFAAHIRVPLVQVVEVVVGVAGGILAL